MTSSVVTSSVVVYSSLLTLPSIILDHTRRYQIQRSQQEMDKHHPPPPPPPPPTQSTIVSHAIAKVGEGQVHQSYPVVYRGLWDALVQLRRQYGWRGLYRGAMVRTLFFTPSTALTMAIYEELKAYL